MKRWFDLMQCVIKRNDYYDLVVLQIVYKYKLVRSFKVTSRLFNNKLYVTKTIDYMYLVLKIIYHSEMLFNYCISF